MEHSFDRIIRQPSSAFPHLEDRQMQFYTANMQHMDLNAVRDFLAVARTGSLNRAALTLDVNATTVGRRIETLEKALGIHLFQRSQTGYALTDDGLDLIERAEQIETAALAFKRRAESADRIGGRVRLATAENLANFILLPALPRLREKHPNLIVEFVTDIRSLNLHRREADLALRLVRPTQGNVKLKRIGEQRYGLYGSSSYLSSCSERMDAENEGLFDVYHLIEWSESYSDLPAAKWIDRALEGRASAVAATSLYGQLVAAREGMGLAVLPCFLAATEQSLRHVPSSADAISQEIWLAIHADLAVSARVRAVADFVEETITEHSDRLAPPR